MKSLRAVAIALLLSVPGAAAADYYYEFETDEGVMSYTDSLRRVPSKYRESAERHEERGLIDYDRATIVEKGASTVSGKNLFGDELASTGDQGIDWSTVNRPMPEDTDRSDSEPRVNIEMGDGVRLDIDTNDGPIFVERRQYKDANGDFIVNRSGVNTEHTVIRQGDNDLVYIEDRHINRR
ncbi:MAG: hypothetical protein GY725_12455 [bacterium]|nr:hypothetical protein [bacterium]